MPTNKPTHHRNLLNGSHQASPDDAGARGSNAGLMPVTRMPGITFSEQALTFPATPAGKPQFKTFTIEQEQVNGPVTLTTNDPDNFQLASDSHPNFAFSLMLTPPAGKTYIHVRYVAAKAGKHSAELSIQSAYSTQTISLSAQSVGALQALVTRPTNPLTPTVPANNRWLPGAVLAAIAGLGIFFYVFRCQLAPGLCTEPAVQVSPAPARIPESEPSARVSAREMGSDRPADVSRRNSRFNKRSQRSPQPVTDANPVATRESDQSPPSPVSQPAAPAPAADTSSSVSTGTTRRSQAATRRPGIARPENQVQKKPQPAPVGVDESELERVLNGKPGNQ